MKRACPSCFCVILTVLQCRQISRTQGGSHDGSRAACGRLDGRGRCIRRRDFLFGAAGALLLAAAGCGKRRWTIEDTRYSDLGTAAARDDIDVCLIGSGPAACALAADLLAAGLTVVMLESGSPDSDSVGMVRARKLDAYETTGLDYPLADTRVRGVGGTTAVWTGRTPRMLPGDFEPHALTPPDNPWPITYEQMKPWYRRAERTLNVIAGPMSASQAPRDEDLPGPPLIDIAEMRALGSRVGLTLDFPPYASAPDPSSRQPIRCAEHMIPALSRHRNCAIVTGATAVGFAFGSPGVADAVLARTYAGIDHEVRAKRFVVACGAVESSRLLLLSRSSAFPNGLGNDTDQVGRHFMEHPFRSCAAEVPGAAFRVWQVGRTYEHCAPLRAEGFGGLVLALYGRPKGGNTVTIKYGIEMRPSPENRITLSESVKDAFGNPGAALHLQLTNADSLLFERARAIVHGLYGDLRSGAVADENEIAWPHHHLGGTRMGTDPAASVVDPDLRVHGTRNVYVASSSVFVTAALANPTLTIVALAHRLAHRLVEGRDRV